MKLTHEVSFSGRFFHMDVDADTLMQDYLLVFRERITDRACAEEIMHDIHARIAELLLAELHTAEQVVTRAMVESIITQLGLPDGSTYRSKDHETQNGRTKKSETDYSDQTHSLPQQKRLYRILDGKRIGGVCNGLADYFDLNVTLIRILFVVALILGSTGFWIYVILWLALPAKNFTPNSGYGKTGNRIFRDPYHKKIAGVCNGLANYLQIDVTLIYCLFIVGVLFGGASFAIYVILWISIPKAKTPAEKCEMYHLPPTAENLAQFSKA